MGSWREGPVQEDFPFYDDLFDYMNSPEGELSAEAYAAVTSALKHIDVDAQNRHILWDDGQRLSITESAQRLHADYPDYPLDLIESKVVTWLLSAFAPPTYTPEQMDELDRLTEAWTKDHERQVEMRQNDPRTPHS